MNLAIFLIFLALALLCLAAGLVQQAQARSTTDGHNDLAMCFGLLSGFLLGVGVTAAVLI